LPSAALSNWARIGEYGLPMSLSGLMSRSRGENNLQQVACLVASGKLESGL